LAQNGLPVRVTGDYLRDFDATALLNPIIPITGPIAWVSYTQYTWRTNGLLKDTIGQRDLPAVVLFDSWQVPNGSSFYLHYAPAYRYRLVEFWDWSANFATVDNSKEGVITFVSVSIDPITGRITINPIYTPRGPVEIFLGDYYDLSNGVWRISR